MNINRVNDRKAAEAFNHSKSKNCVQSVEQGFKDSLLKNMDIQAPREVLGPITVHTREKTEEIAVTDALRQLGKSPLEKAGTAKEANVRNLPYMQCDKIRINVLEGYVMKAKLEENGEGAYPFVYVEAKYDDGRVSAYQVEVCKIPAGTDNPVEQIAADVGNLPQ